MQINDSALDALFYNFTLIFQQGYEQQKTFFDPLFTQVNSTTRENRYPWVRRIARMREWVGERVLHNLESANYSLVNKDWEDGFIVDRNDIEDDNLGLFTGQIQQLAYAAKKWPDDVMKPVLQAGITATCYDGLPFFSASHPVGRAGSGLGTFSNRQTSTPLNAANFQASLTLMSSYVDDAGKTMSIMPTHLIVPKQLEPAARQLLNAEFIAPTAAVGFNAANVQQSNVFRNSVELIVIPELNNEAAVWYLADLSKPIKPLVFQQRRAPTITSLTDPTSPMVFKQKQFAYAIDARGNGGYTLPWLMLRNEG